MKRSIASAAAIVVALAFSACGGDDDESEEAGTTGTQQEQPAPAGEPSEAVQVSETEYRIDTVDEVKAGPVIFGVTNDGEETHALEVEGNGIEEETEEIAPGESATLEVDLPAGTYKLYCPIGNHEDQGMVGELTVGGAPGGGGSENETESEGGDDSRY